MFLQAVPLALAFLLPVVTAIVAGALTRKYYPDTDSLPLHEIIAAALGFVGGGILAWVIMPLIKKHYYEPKS